MLDAFIIEQIKRREQKDERLQPRLEHPNSRLPWAPPDWVPEAERERQDRSGRGHSYDDRDDRDGRGRSRHDEEHDGIVILDM